MSDYVENGYSENYVEGDSTPSESVNCDLTGVLSELADIKAQNIALNTKLDTVLSAIQSNNALNLEINNKLIDIDSDIASIPQIDISNLVTTDYIDNKIPFVDDQSLIIFPNGSEVITSIGGGVFTVESSKFIPTDPNTYTVVYTLSKEIEGIKKFSDFNSSYVYLKDDEMFMLRSDCSADNGG